MFKKLLLCPTLVLFGFLALVHPDNSMARQVVFLGSAGVGYDYTDRTYSDDDEEGLVVNQDDADRRDYTVRAEFELESLGIHDSLSLRYSPVFRYDDLNYDTDIDHYLAFSGERFLTKYWVVKLDDNFVLSDDPERYESPFVDTGAVDEEAVAEGQVNEAPDEITYNLGRRRYWTNDLIIETIYTYAEESELGFGYTFRVLRNESDDEALVDYDEYDRHEFRGFGSYRFNPSWRSNVDLRYVQGLYDEIQDETLPQGTEVPSQDLEEYRANAGLDYIMSVQDSFPVLYSFQGTKYDDEERRESRVHGLTVGWIHAFDQQTTLDIVGGPSYIDIEDLEEEWGYNGFLSITRRYQRGSVNASLSKRYEPSNFTGGDDTGLTDTTSINIDLTYQFTPQFSSTLFGLYRYEDILDPQGDYYASAVADSNVEQEQDVDDVTYTRESFSVGASVQYTFLRWFAASLRYSYFEQDGDVAGDTYDDHRIMFEISASKELWRM